MTYAKNSTIIASDFNTLSGVTASAAGSSSDALNKAAYLWGIGYGDRGYGQATYSIANRSAGNNIAGEWRNLQSILTEMTSWQGSSAANIPPASNFAVGYPVTAHRTADGNTYNIETALALVDTNRMNYQVGNMILTSDVASSIQPNQWGNAGSTTITAEFTCTFSSEDEARFFFNTGGQIRISLAHPNTSTTQDLSWYNALNGMNIGFSAHATSRLAGTTGTGSSIGYYELTTSYQTVFSAINFLSGVYTTNDYSIKAKATSITGASGAKGSQIVFQVSLTDESSNAYSDLVNSGTTASISLLKAATLSIVSPSISKTLGFSGLSYAIVPPPTLFTASTTWVVPVGISSVNIIAIGGGGGGGGGSSRLNYYYGAGGGGGSAAGVYTTVAVTPGETLTITVGGGGAAGAARDGPYSTGSSGGTGGHSGVQRGASWIVLAYGGGGGSVAPYGLNGFVAAGGAVGTIGAGTTLSTGDNGERGWNHSGADGSFWAALGGYGGRGYFVASNGTWSRGALGIGGVCSIWSGGPAARNASSGSGYGAGGSGGGACLGFNSTTFSGSVGLAGCVAIWY